jgi:hypothetical protein
MPITADEGHLIIKLVKNFEAEYKLTPKERKYLKEEGYFEINSHSDLVEGTTYPITKIALIVASFFRVMKTPAARIDLRAKPFNNIDLIAELKRVLDDEEFKLVKISTEKPSLFGLGIDIQLSPEQIVEALPLPESKHISTLMLSPSKKSDIKRPTAEEIAVADARRKMNLIMFKLSHGMASLQIAEYEC